MGSWSTQTGWRQSEKIQGEWLWNECWTETGTQMAVRSANFQIRKGVGVAWDDAPSRQAKQKWSTHLLSEPVGSHRGVDVSRRHRAWPLYPRLLRLCLQDAQTRDQTAAHSSSSPPPLQLRTV